MIHPRTEKRALPIVWLSRVPHPRPQTGQVHAIDCWVSLKQLRAPPTVSQMQMGPPPAGSARPGGRAAAGPAGPGSRRPGPAIMHEKAQNSDHCMMGRRAQVAGIQAV